MTVMNPFPYFRDYTWGTPVIPDIYWNSYSYEERIKKLCMEYAKLKAYEDDLVDTVNDQYKIITEMEEQFPDLVDADVKAELAAMAEDGRLLAVVQDYIKAYVDQISEEWQGEIATAKTNLETAQTTYNGAKAEADNIIANLGSITAGTEVAEVVDARVNGVTSTTYTTLKGRCDGDYTVLSGEIGELRDTTRNIWTYGDQSFTATKIVGTQGGDTIIPAGKYTVSVEATTDAGANPCIIFYSDSGGSAPYAFSQDGSRSSRTITFAEDITRVFFMAAGSISASSGKTATYANIQVEEGSDATEYITPHTAKDMTARDAAEDALELSQNTVDEYIGLTKPNLFDHEYSSLTNAGLTYTVNADRSVSISGTKNTSSLSSQKCSVTLQPGSYLLSGLDSESSRETYEYFVVRADGSYAESYGGKDYAFTVSSEETITIYIRVPAASGTEIDTTIYPMIREASHLDGTYCAYGEYQYGGSGILNEIDNTEFNWSGKKMNVIGDSIVYGAYGNFINVISRILNLETARNYGVGGSCLASSSQDEKYAPAVKRYSSMDEDADIIIVHAGTNDYSAQIPLGDSDSTDITTFNGALNTMMDGLRTMYPSALIIFDSILHRYNDNSSSLAITTTQYRKAIEERCEAKHIVFYDAYKYTGFDFAKGYYDHVLTTDGLHPNQAGANILGRKLAGFIRWN